jgi:hypothetical protein
VTRSALLSATDSDRCSSVRSHTSARVGPYARLVRTDGRPPMVTGPAWPGSSPAVPDAVLAAKEVMRRTNRKGKAVRTRVNGKEMGRYDALTKGGGRIADERHQ